MTNHLVVTASPHMRAKSTTTTLMLDVLIALLPALVASVIIFGYRALVLEITCVVACVVFEYLYRRMLKLSNTISDLSATVTGLLLAFNLPVGLPLWMAVIGCFVAIVIIKQLFGGIGKNFANPAIVARIVLLLSFLPHMTKWVLPINSVTPEVISGATALGIVSNPEAVLPLPGYLDMFLGQIGGCIGETCTLALLIGGVYLVLRRVITITTPLAYMLTVFVLSFILGADPLFHLLAGGLVLGAIFMATDYSTTPTTEKGKLVFGIGCGIITVIIRIYGSYPEGVSYAILIMNIITPHIDRLTAVKAFGGAKAR